MIIDLVLGITVFGFATPDVWLAFGSEVTGLTRGRFDGSGASGLGRRSIGADLVLGIIALISAGIAALLFAWLSGASVCNVSSLPLITCLSGSVLEYRLAYAM